MKSGSSGANFDCCGLELKRDTYREFVLVRDGTDKVAVFGGNSDDSYTKGSSTVAFSNPNAKLAKVRFYFLNKFGAQHYLGTNNSQNDGKLYGSAIFKDIKIDDISASPF